MAAHRVQALLMGGQACVFYGAAEFSRDTRCLALRVLDPQRRQRDLTGPRAERERDRAYWQPLKAELELLRRTVRQ